MNMPPPTDSADTLAMPTIAPRTPAIDGLCEHERFFGARRRDRRQSPSRHARRTAVRLRAPCPSRRS
jgi:hypothetical protein